MRSLFFSGLLWLVIYIYISHERLVLDMIVIHIDLFMSSFQISYGLCKLVHYLAHSPYGSLVLSDYRRQQFVLIDGDLKLTDLDDIGFTEPFCLLDTDCEHYYSSTDVTLK